MGIKSVSGRALKKSSYVSGALIQLSKSILTVSHMLHHNALILTKKSSLALKFHHCQNDLQKGEIY